METELRTLELADIGAGDLVEDLLNLANCANAQEILDEISAGRMTKENFTRMVNDLLLLFDIVADAVDRARSAIEAVASEVVCAPC